MDCSGLPSLTGSQAACVDAIKSNSSSEVFLNDSTNKKEANMRQIADALVSNNSLKSLYLRGVDITNKTFIKLIINSSHNQNFRKLDLVNSNISNLNVSQIAEALDNSSLEDLTIGLSNIDKDTAVKISAQLSEERKTKLRIGLWGGYVVNGSFCRLGVSY